MDFSNIVQNWDKYSYPWRPGASFLNHIKSEIGEIEKPKILLLGSTPEIRELCMGEDFTICDNSPEMIDGLSVGNEDETVLMQDWFSLSDHKERYDLIIGDLIFLMFDEEKASELIGVMKNILNQRGKLLVRDVLQQESLHRESYDFTTLDGCNLASFDLICGKGYSREEIVKYYDVTEVYQREYFHIIPYKDGDARVKSELYFHKHFGSIKELQRFQFCSEILLEYKNGKSHFTNPEI